MPRVFAAVLAGACALAMPVALIQNRGLVPLAALAGVAALAALAGGWREALAAVARGPFAAAAALSLWAIASALWAAAPGAAFMGGVRLAALVIALAAIVTAAASLPVSAREWVSRALIGGAAAGAALLVVELVAGAPLNNALRGFPMPPRNAEVTKPAATLLVLLAGPVLLMVSARAGWRGAAALGAAFAAAVLMSTSEAARLGLIAAIGAGAAALALPGLTRRVLPAALALAVLAAPPLLDQVARGATRAGMLPLSAVHRTLIWDYAAERAAERPFAGFGMDAARSLPGGRDNPDVARLDALGIQGPARDFFIAAPRGLAELIPLHTHSMPLQVRLELGFVGLALFALFAFLAGRAAAALPGRAALAAGAAVAASAAVVSLLSYGVWQHWWWVSVALAAAALAAIARDGR
ncbi:O-antigen ligase family protein [Elioraea sp.]|uniref:O-antigen ligase family protein n=1 Tax=Elioraea sp. TaxID=2185103 RepID=UPI0025B8502E|nr:O-antigen ligase family protein [Elioraea sp.]